ncbi:MAG TPA: hypothetical protein VGN44_06185, partial [Candidatus Angelobacter sp.]
MSDEQQFNALDLFGVTKSSSLATYNPYQVDDRVYKEQNLHIDGYHFKNCAFIRCNLQVSRGNFSIDKCYFQNCTLY